MLDSDWIEIPILSGKKQPGAPFFSIRAVRYGESARRRPGASTQLPRLPPPQPASSAPL